MQKIFGYMRKAIADYSMISDGDKIAVGVSGGKDSVAMLAGFIKLRDFLGMQFEIIAVIIDPCFGGEMTDYSLLEALCVQNDVKCVIKRSDLGNVIFTERKEKNPCSLCARMRRGMLHDLCKEHGANKLSLGHNYNDAVETFVMNLFYEGRIGCFQPVTYLSRKDITAIRPLIYAPEKEILSEVNRSKLPIVKSKCPIDGATARQTVKMWLVSMEKGGYPGMTKRIFGAIKRGHINGW